MISSENIDLIVYDFDGVMTNNTALIFQDGTEAVIVNRSDGLGVSSIRDLNIPQIIISTEANPVVQARANKLKIDCYQNCYDKASLLAKICTDKGYDLSRTIFVGNDTNDLKAMKIVGYPISPSDGHSDVQAVASYVLESKGGEGVIREIFEKLIKK